VEGINGRAETGYPPFGKYLQLAFDGDYGTRDSELGKSGALKEP